METEPDISIRPYQTSDADGLVEAARESISEVSRFLPWCHPDFSHDEARAWIELKIAEFESGAEFQFVISFDNRIAGGCGLNLIDNTNQRANLGYWVRSSVTGRGIATRATRLLVDWAYENTELNRIEVIASVKNLPSIRVANKAGAVREGILRNRLLLYGEYHDAMVFSFIRPQNDNF